MQFHPPRPDLTGQYHTRMALFLSQFLVCLSLSGISDLADPVGVSLFCVALFASLKDPCRDSGKAPFGGYRVPEPEKGTHSHQIEPRGPLLACHLPLGGESQGPALALSHIAAHVDLTIDNKSFRSPKLKEILPVGPLLLMCLLLPYPALGTELKRDPTRSYATPCKVPRPRCSVCVGCVPVTARPRYPSNKVN